jgi:hypothetical protein
VLCGNENERLKGRQYSRAQFERRFRWEAVHQAYVGLLSQWLQPAVRRAPQSPQLAPPLAWRRSRRRLIALDSFRKP